MWARRRRRLALLLLPALLLPREALTASLDTGNGLGLRLAPAAPWKQQRFAITFLEAEFVPAAARRAYYRAIASLNFTVAEGWGEGRPIGDVDANLLAAGAAGLDSIVSGYEGVPLTNSSSPHLLGFLVKDEPFVREFAGLANWTAQLAATHPGKLRFINLLPNCSAMGTPLMSNASYTEYVHQFVQGKY